MLSSDMLEEAVPGNIRKAEHFIAFLKRFIEYLKVSLQHVGETKPADRVDTHASAARRRRDTTVLSRPS